MKGFSGAALEDLYNYYNILALTRKNQETREQKDYAVANYPNSVTILRSDPYNNAISEKYVATDSPRSNAKYYPREKSQSLPADILPENVYYYSYLTITRNWRQWIEIFSNNIGTNDNISSEYRRDNNHFLIGTTICVLLIICAGWIVFFRKILLARIYGSEQFLSHLNALYQLARATVYNKRSRGSLKQNLFLKFSKPPNTPSRLSWLMLNAKDDAVFTNFCNQALKTKIANQKELSEFLPGLRLGFYKIQNESHKVSHKGGYGVFITDLELAMASPVFRSDLLDMIYDIKSMIHNQPAEQSDNKDSNNKRIVFREFSIYTDYQAIQKLTRDDGLLKTNSQSNTIETYQADEKYSWLYCLMDFEVVTDKQPSLDWQLLKQEIKALPRLASYINNQRPQVDSNEFDTLRWYNLYDGMKSVDEWQTIRFIITKAELAYSFLWHSLGKSEKLALYHLARLSRINPINHNVLENLASMGLIKVKRGQIIIVNQSFASFVRHAESDLNLENLLNTADAGLWKDYRWLIIFVLILGIFVLATLSGYSLYTIVASIVGFLATSVTVMTNINSIRNLISR